jgi:hypothetical protein
MSVVKDATDRQVDAGADSLQLRIKIAFHSQQTEILLQIVGPADRKSEEGNLKYLFNKDCGVESVNQLINILKETYIMREEQ